MNYNIDYKKPAFYDDELIIETTLQDLQRSKIIFEYKTLNKKNEIINTASITLVFVNKSTNKPCSAPKILLEKLI